MAIAARVICVKVAVSDELHVGDAVARGAKSFVDRPHVNGPIEVDHLPRLRRESGVEQEDASWMLDDEGRDHDAFARKAIRDTNEGGPQPAVDQGDVAVDQACSDNVGRAVNAGEHREDVMARGVSPPTPADRLAGKQPEVDVKIVFTGKRPGEKLSMGFGFVEFNAKEAAAAALKAMQGFILDGHALPWDELAIAAVGALVLAVASVWFVVRMLAVFRARGYISRYV